MSTPVIDIEAMTTEERLELIEKLEASLLNGPVPDWHKEILDKREAELRAGNMEILDIDEVIASL
ncbi:MAG: addiction module protein [Henriciella sp.]|uniref:addiction module protein n=1 Tax=Henriciella sp. TaxID=1968823 RepID=UPI003C74151D